MKKMKWNYQSKSVALTFLILSVLFGSWLARLPEVQQNLQIGEGILGMALLGMPIGAFAGTQLAPLLIGRLGVGRSTFLSTLLFSLSMILPALATSAAMLFGFLILIGLVDGWMNVSMNNAAARLEKLHNSSIMSSCHGMFSLGAMLGAASAGWLASWGITFSQQQVMMIGLMLILLFVIKRGLDQIEPGESKRQRLSWPDKAVWAYVLIGFFIMMGEGAIADWSAIYLRNSHDTGLFLASMGFAAFSGAMAVGRFSGDHLRKHYTAITMVTIGCLLGAIGLLLTVMELSIGLSIIGFFIAGIGFSIVVPLLFILGADVSANAEQGIAAIATAGIIGYLISPPLIGLVGEWYGLRFAFIGIALVAILAGLWSLGLRQKRMQITAVAVKKRS